MAVARPPRLLSSLLAATVLLGLTACATNNAPVTASPTGSASPTAAPTTAASTPSATPTASADFPSTARLYGEAVLLAWRSNQLTRLGDLVTSTVLSQLQSTGAIEPNWAYLECQGAAGSSYCQFRNGDGDAVTVRLDNQLLGKAHATTEVKLDLTTYSNNAVEYVKAFIEAWRNANTKRMATLANQTEVDYFTHYVPPETYSTCATITSGFANVRVYNADGLDYTLTIAVATLGNKHAITGHSATAAACP